MYGHIAPHWRDALAQVGLGSLATMLAGDIGEPIKQKPDSTVHRLTLQNGEVVYLKRYVPPRAWRVVRRMGGLHRPHGAGVIEARTTRILRKAGIDAMETVAWGERRLAGFWPQESFNIVRHIEGHEVVDLYRGGGVAERVQLLAAIGRLQGQLHAAGFYYRLRLRDLIARNWPPDDGEMVRLAMIDLDLKGGRPQLHPFEPERASANLAYTVYLFIRSGRWRLTTPAELASFFRQYRATLHAAGHRLPAGFLRRCSDEIDRHLARHREDTWLRETFPTAPQRARV